MDKRNIYDLRRFLKGHPQINEGFKSKRKIINHNVFECQLDIEGEMTVFLADYCRWVLTDRPYEPKKSPTLMRVGNVCCAEGHAHAEVYSYDTCPFEILILLHRPSRTAVVLSNDGIILAKFAFK